MSGPGPFELGRNNWVEKIQSSEVTDLELDRVTLIGKTVVGNL